MFVESNPAPASCQEISFRNQEAGLQVGPVGRRETFAEKVSAVLRKTGLQQKDLAFRSGVPQSTLNAILRGQIKEPSLSAAVRIAQALGVPLETLTEGGAVPQSTLTPYDTQPEFRRVVDALVPLDERDRARVIEFISWLGDALPKNLDDGGRESVSSGTPTKSGSAQHGEGLGRRKPGDAPAPHPNAPGRAVNPNPRRLDARSGEGTEKGRSRERKKR